MLQELASALLLLLLIIIGSAAGCFVALEIHREINWRRKHKREVAAMLAGTPCPRWNHNTSAHPGKCGLILTDHKCPVHGLIRETMPK